MASVGTALPHPRSTTQVVPQARGPGAAVARRGGQGSPRDCPKTRPPGARVLLAGDASRCKRVCSECDCALLKERRRWMWQDHTPSRSPGTGIV